MSQEGGVTQKGVTLRIDWEKTLHCNTFFVFGILSAIFLMRETPLHNFEGLRYWVHFLGIIFFSEIIRDNFVSIIWNHHLINALSESPLSLVLSQKTQELSTGNAEICLYFKKSRIFAPSKTFQEISDLVRFGLAGLKIFPKF